MEGSPLLPRNESKTVWVVLVGVLVLAVAGLTIAVIVVATHEGGSVEVFSERCMFVDELNKLKSDTHGMFRENRNRLVSLISDTNDTDIVYLRGSTSVTRNDDVTYLFRQNSDFIYLTGVDFEDAHLIIHPKTAHAVLFVPRRSPDYAVWSGIVLTPDEIRVQYDVDEVLYVDELTDYVISMAINVVYTVRGAVFPVNNYTVDSSYLNSFMDEARRVKSEKEIAVLKFVSSITSHAHEYTMRKCAYKLKKYDPVWEYELESYFLHSTYNCKGRFQAYTSIVAGGVHGSILHYIENDARVNPNDVVLMDAGAELWGYGSDVTRTFPANGKFSDKQIKVYNIVLKAQTETAALLKEGVLWSDLNNVTRRVLTEELMSAHFINGTFEELWNNSIYQYFYPHSVGHSLGLDVHDSDFGTAPLVSGAYITIEPGIYFNKAKLDVARNNTLISHYFMWDNINQYADFGGVRIEDDYLVRKNGYEKFTSITSDIKGLEKLISKSI